MRDGFLPNRQSDAMCLCWGLTRGAQGQKQKLKDDITVVEIPFYIAASNPPIIERKRPGKGGEGRVGVGKKVRIEFYCFIVPIVGYLEAFR